MKMENSGSLEGHWNEGAQFDDEDDVTSSKDRSRVSSIPAEVMIQGDFLSIPQPKGWGCRHTLVVLGFTGLCVTYLNRINLSIAIVAMVAVNSSSPAGNDSEICPFPPDWNATSGDATIKGEFDWDPAIQGILLGCFFYGYAVSNFFGGLAVERYGSRIVLAFSVFVSSLASIVSPICARTSIGLFIGARVLSGLAQGPVFPCIHNLLATWNPPQDRARFGSVLFPGVNIGTILTLSLGGLMNESDFLGGWPSIFYVFGVLGILWCIPWLIFMRDSPQKHPKISREELNYIEAQGSTVRTTVRMKIPWRDVLTSVPYWTLIIIAWGDSFGFYTFLTEVPTYLKNIQHFGSADTGLTSALPHLAAALVSFGWGATADLLIARTSMSVTAVRKLSTGLGMYVASLSLVAMCFVDCNSTLAVVVLCVSVGVNACGSVGGAIAEQDIAPNLTAALKGISNTVGAVSGIVAPLITGLVTSDNQTIDAWRTVFLTAAVTYFVSCTAYLLFGTNKVQPWNLPKDERVKGKNKP
ncbi:putative inorganic phosphate cotransporter isoform X1 [Macrobrachium nipponense]|uniref:putative inorganic phosphate cotransporter isoform X1 n=1 Tax=Macrobrachium nipponense TaxID=159736 RepID=UPI0030C8A74D